VVWVVGIVAGFLLGLLLIVAMFGLHPVVAIAVFLAVTALAWTQRRRASRPVAVGFLVLAGYLGVLLVASAVTQIF
jgi:hypothetical protein